MTPSSTPYSRRVGASPPSRRLGAAALLVMLCMIWTTDARALGPVPRPNLETVEPAVRDQLTAERRRLDSLLAKDPAGSPELAAVFGRVAMLYHAYDLTSAAEIAYANAAELDPDEPRWSYLLGVLHQMNGDLTAAEKRLRAALAARPNDLPTLLRLSEVVFDRRDLDRSASYARAALELDPKSAAAHYRLGRVASARGDAAAAVEHFERALALDPRATRVHYALAQAYRRRGDLERARHHLERQGGVDVGFRDPLVAEMRALLAGAGALQQRGFIARAAGQYEEALEYFRRAVEADPKNVEARRDLGSVLLDLGRTEAAIEQFETALALAPERAAAHHELGLLLAEAGRHDEALQRFAEAVRRAPDHVEFRLRLARQQAAAGRYRDAVASYDAVVSREPGNVDARLGRARALYELGEHEAAARAATAIETLDASAAERAGAELVLALVDLRRGDAARSSERLRRVLELDDRQAEAHFQLANLAGQRGDLAAAARHYRRAIDLEPARVAARLGEATALALGGSEQPAIARLEAGLEPTARDPRLLHTLARLLLTARDPAHRDPARAYALADDLFRRHPTLEHGETLAMALAATARPAAAARLQRTLVDKARAAGNAQLVTRLEAALRRYEQAAGAG